MKIKTIIFSILIIIISISGFAIDVKSCVHIAKAVAVNVAVAQSDLGNAQAIAIAIAKAGDVTAISKSIATVNSELGGIAVAIAAGYAVKVGFCPELKNILKNLNIHLNTAYAGAINIAEARTNPKYRHLAGSIQSAIGNIRDGISKIN